MDLHCLGKLNFNSKVFKPIIVVYLVLIMARPILINKL